MILFPNAKINIGLFITEKRTDGFHNLESCFFPIEWQDILEIIPAETKSSFSSTGIKIPGNSKNNICLKAFDLLKKEYNIPEVKIHLHKQIPIGAGLGGGSSDGAFMLKGLNKLFNLKLSNEQLKNFARQLGSDCAFFIDNKAVFANQKGDEFDNIKLDLKGYYLYLINPNIHISTAEAYTNIKPQAAPINLKEVLSRPPKTWKNLVGNDFEKSLFPNHPDLEDIKTKFYKMGAEYASMSGSGSTIYGVFKNKPEPLFNNMKSLTYQVS
jgi:4-diphosphocytidyl-2-C-methyl-D-erythritol kinase